MNNLSQPYFEIDPGMEMLDAACVIRQGETRFKLNVTKKETEEKTYKLAIQFMGIEHLKPRYGVLIDDKPVFIEDPKEESMDTLSLIGSESIKVKPAGLDFLVMKETDLLDTTKIWIQLGDLIVAYTKCPKALRNS